MAIKENADIFFDLTDPAIDVAELTHQLQERYLLRKAEAEAQGVDYASLLDAKSLTTAYQLNRRVTDLWVNVDVRDQGFPLFNSLVMRLKRAFHELVVIYVNELAGKQAAVNSLFTHTLTELTEVLEHQRLRIVALERQNTELLHRLAEVSKHPEATLSDQPQE